MLAYNLQSLFYNFNHILLGKRVKHLYLLTMSQISVLMPQNSTRSPFFSVLSWMFDSKSNPSGPKTLKFASCQLLSHWAAGLMGSGQPTRLRSAQRFNSSLFEFQRAFTHHAPLLSSQTKGPADAVTLVDFTVFPVFTSTKRPNIQHLCTITVKKQSDIWFKSDSL